MAVIIGAGSTVTSTQFPNGGIVSVNFGFQPSVNRLYQLGSFDPYDTDVQKKRTIQLNVYGVREDGSGGSTPLDVSPSTDCTDAGNVSITVNPASCVGSLLPFTDDYFVNSYSYSKDNLGYGQEAWGFTSKTVIPGYTGSIVMLRGIAEGTLSTGPGTMDPGDMGLTVNESASNDVLGAPIQGETGSVQAGSPGIGNYEISRHVIVTSVGGSIGKNDSIDGLTGQASIQIPLNEVFL